MNNCQRGLHEFVVMIAIALSVFTCTNSSVRAQRQYTKAEEDAVALARKALSASLSIPVDRWQLLSVTAVQWRDSSLGCPERGKVYTPSLSSGFKVTLRDGGTQHVVNVSGGNAWICTSQSEPRLPPDALLAVSKTAGDAVRAEIARVLKIPAAQVRVTSVRPARKDDTCAPAGAKGLGHIVDARVGGKTFRYYTDAAVTKRCEPDPKR